MQLLHAPATERLIFRAGVQIAQRSYFRPRPRPTVARRRDVTGSEAWDRLRPGEASPTRQPGVPALARQLFLGPGRGAAKGEGVRPVTARAGPACRPLRVYCCSRRASSLPSSFRRLPALLTDRRRPQSPRPPPRPRSRPAYGVAAPDL